MTQEQSCAHHWLIETPKGPMAHGRCKLCGEERDFDNGYFFEKIGKKAIHETTITAGLRSILGPNMMEEAYKE